MDCKIETFGTLYNLIDHSNKQYDCKEIAKLLLQANDDWPIGIESIQGFIDEVKQYFGTPLLIKGIKSIRFNGSNTWKLESGSYIIEILELSLKIYGQENFDLIINKMLAFYESEFIHVDFIAELQYFSTDEGGRRTPDFSGYRPQIKFDLYDMVTSGKQMFYNSEKVEPGNMIKAKVKIIASDYFTKKLQEGMTFKFNEGSRVIGSGVIQNIVNDKLEKKF